MQHDLFLSGHHYYIRLPQAVLLYTANSHSGMIVGLVAPVRSGKKLLGLPGAIVVIERPNRMNHVLDGHLVSPIAYIIVYRLQT